MKSKILFFTPTEPSGNISGGILKTKKLVDLLSDKYDTLFVSLSDSPSGNSLFHSLGMSDKRRAASFSNYVGSFLFRLPFPIYRNFSEESYFKLKSMVEDFQPEIVFIDHYLLGKYIDLFDKCKVILHQHNAEFLIWERKSQICPNYFLSLLYKLESYRVRLFEQNLIEKVDAVLCSPNDKIFFSSFNSFSSEKFFDTYHLGDDTLLNSPRAHFDRTKLQLVFLGKMTWEPNYDGFTWFVKNCWGILKNRFPKLTFVVAGEYDKKLADFVSAYEGIELLGYVNDISSVLDVSRVFISTLRYGSGMKVKNITALYKGIPIVTTAVGAEGILLEDKINSFISDEPDILIESIAELLTNKNIWEQFSKSSRYLAEQNYCWESEFVRVSEVIDNVC